MGGHKNHVCSFHRKYMSPKGGLWCFSTSSYPKTISKLKEMFWKFTRLLSPEKSTIVQLFLKVISQISLWSSIKCWSNTYYYGGRTIFPLLDPDVPSDIRFTSPTKPLCTPHTDPVVRLGPVMFMFAQTKEIVIPSQSQWQGPCDLRLSLSHRIWPRSFYSRPCREKAYCWIKRPCMHGYQVKPIYTINLSPRNSMKCGGFHYSKTRECYIPSLTKSNANKDSKVLFVPSLFRFPA